jgi:hypothetical protein
MEEIPEVTRKVVPFSKNKKVLAEAVNEFQEMLCEYVGGIFGTEIAHEALRVLPEVLADPENWRIGSRALTEKINSRSERIKARFGDHSHFLAMSAKGMLRKVGREHGCEPLTVAGVLTRTEG